MMPLAPIPWSLAVLALTAAAAQAGAELYYSGSLVTDHPGVPQQDTPVLVRSNILQNPGFETGELSPWTSAGWTVINSDFHSGAYSAQGVTNIWIRQDFTPVDVTTINAVSVWEKQPSGTAFAAIDLIYSSDADYDEFLLNPGRDWTFIDLTSRLRASGNLSAIRFWSYSGGGDQITRIDDVVVDTQGATPTMTTSWGTIKDLYR